jgi:hypothetical protein
MNLLQSKYAAITIFLAGFLWDVFTLNRIDNPIDNLILGSYLLMAAICLILSQGLATGKIKAALLHRYPSIWRFGLQFFLGGLFSAYVVYYFRSTTISSTLFFIVLMIILLLANEFLPRRLGNIYLQTGLFTIASFSYFIYLIPVLIKHMGTLIFVLSGLVSLGLVYGLVNILVSLSHDQLEYTRKRLWLSVGTVYLVIGILYVLNLIPPIPLAAKHIGAYTQYERTNEGFRLEKADMGLLNALRFWEERVPLTQGEPIHVFASVFAPTGMKFGIVHHWQKFNETTQKWDSVDKINYQAVGGRDGGYRGVSKKSALSEGLWRVDIEDDRGFVVARMRIRFTNEPAKEHEWIEI